MSWGFYDFWNHGGKLGGNDVEEYQTMLMMSQKWMSELKSLT